MTLEERSRRIAETMRKYSIGNTRPMVPINPVVSAEVYQRWVAHFDQMIMGDNLDEWTCGSVYGSACASNGPAQHPLNVKSGKTWLAAQELFERLEFSMWYEQSDRFVEYEARDSDWAVFFGFVRRKRMVREIHLSPDDYRRVIRMSPEAMPFERDPERPYSIYGVPIMSTPGLEPGQWTLRFDDGTQQWGLAPPLNLVDVLTKIAKESRSELVQSNTDQW